MNITNKTRRASIMILVSLCVGLCATILSCPTSATAASLPTGSVARLASLSSSGSDQYSMWSGNWSQPDRVYYYRGGDGALNVVTVDNAGTLTVTPFTIPGYRAGNAKTVSFTDFPVWGGFYAAPDGFFYIAVGRDNLNEDPNAQVVAVRKYDSSWSLRGTGYLNGDASQMFEGVWQPFAAGRADMALSGSTLVVHMARTMFAINGVHHQSNLTFEVDTATMAVATYEQAHGAWTSPYSSHSFNQFVRVSGDDLVTADHGDAYPRGIQLAVAKGYATGSASFTEKNIFSFPGQIGDNYTGTTLTGMEVGGGAALVTGNSVPHDQAVGGVTGDDGSLSRNVYLISTNIETQTPTFRWITSFSPNGMTAAGEPRLVKVSESRFVLLFDVTDGVDHTLNYRLVDNQGNVLAEKSWPNTIYNPISEPILIGSRLYWAGYGNADFPSMSPLYLYALDTDVGHTQVIADVAGYYTGGSATTAGGFTSLSPSRVLDTRTAGGTIAANSSRSVQVTGNGGVPSSGVSAVVLNVTVTETTGGGFLTVSPTGVARPTASNLNWSGGGTTIPNSVVVKVGTGGKVDLYQSGPGTAQVIVDVAGYYMDGTVTEPGGFTSLSPSRILDTRSADGKITSGSTRSVQVTGRGGVPSSGVAAVVVNTTVTETTAGGYLAVSPTGTTRPTVSNLNWSSAGTTIPNLAIVTLGTGGKLDLYQSGPGTAQVIMDVAGYFMDGTATKPGMYVSLTPARVMDTRTTGAVQGGTDATLMITGKGGVPTTGVSAVVINTTVTETTNGGFLTVYPGTSSLPTASNLNWSAAGVTIPNLVTVKTGTDGTLKFRNGSTPTTDLITDQNG